jgi:hypothetical protein
MGNKLRPKEKRKKDTNTGTPAGIKRNQQIKRNHQIMITQNPFPEEKKKKGDKHRTKEERRTETSVGKPGRISKL